MPLELGSEDVFSTDPDLHIQPFIGILSLKTDVQDRKP
uniref:Uncharacterized protein n=1 Tax=Nelumbo nucifera TaxID=4432 RepID=A0A822Z2X3_NELNU|nr:TPA_asm: hypothetical protein HUJ06_013363 [Nelumbo nucifera]